MIQHSIVFTEPIEEEPGRDSFSENSSLPNAVSWREVHLENESAPTGPRLYHGMGLPDAMRTIRNTLRNGEQRCWL